MQKHILFLFQGDNNWLSVVSLYEYMQAKQPFRVSVVLTPTSKTGDYTQLPTSDYFNHSSTILIDGRNPELFQHHHFDAVILSLPYDDVRPPHLRAATLKQHIPHLFYIPYALDIDVGYADIRNRFHYDSLTLATAIFARSEYVKQDFKKYAVHGDKQIHITGLPRFDLIHQIDTFTPDPKLTEQVAKRPCILINHHHSINLFGVSTFDQYGLELLTNLAKRQEIATIWRPHPGLWSALKNQGVIKNYEIIQLKQALTDAGIIIDERPDYRHAFKLSSACISDGSSFLLEYLLMRKPILFQQAFIDERLMSEEAKKLLNGYPKSVNLTDSIYFVNQLMADKLSPPNVPVSDFLFGIDGQASQRISDVILFKIATR